MGKLNTTEFKVGATALIATTILILGIIWGKEFSFETNKYDIQVLFDNVGGMVPGDPVTVNGVKEGKIKSIGWQGRKVLCTLEINDYVRLYEDAEFVVISAELLAGMKVEINPGKSPGHLNLAQQPFQGRYGGRIVDVGLTIDELAKDMSALSFRLDTTFMSINRLLREGNLQQDIKQSLHSINRMTNSLEEVPADLQITLNEIRDITEKLNRVLTDNDSNISSTLKNFSAVSTRLDTISQALGRVMHKIEDRQGTLGKLVNDSSLYANLNRTLLSIDSLAQQIKREGVEVSLF